MSCTTHLQTVTVGTRKKLLRENTLHLGYFIVGIKSIKITHLIKTIKNILVIHHCILYVFISPNFVF